MKDQGHIHTLPHDHGGAGKGGHSAEELLLALSSTDFSGVAELFKLLSDPTRVRILWVLSHGEECVINLSAMLAISSPALSHHLRVLKESGLLESRREGKEVYYRVPETEVCRLLHLTVERITEIGCPDAPAPDDATNESIIRAVHDHLVENLDKRITIEELSKAFHINPTTLKNEFKRAYRTSIAAHINEHRMEKAAHLLAEGERSIEKVARLVGFSSQSRFTTAFKARHGVTPTEYRASRGGRGE